jgi:hypothetical protein
MPIEAATNINGLNPLWPLGGDPKSAGDDHLRLIKSVLQGAISDDGTTVQLKKSSGFIRQQVITTTGAITLHADTKAFLVEVQGGGGAGGQSAASPPVGQGSAGGGGGSGGYVAKWKVKPTGTYSPACTIGAGSSSGQSGNNSGFSDGTDTLTAGGGIGGGTGINATIVSVTGGAGGSASGGDVNVPGEPGDASFVVVISGAVMARGGKGGGSKFGGGGLAPGATSGSAGGANGASATGRGAGGSGGFSINAGGLWNAGANGTGGLVVITEFR